MRSRERAVVALGDNLAGELTRGELPGLTPDRPREPTGKIEGIFARARYWTRPLSTIRFAGDVLLYQIEIARRFWNLSMGTPAP